MEFTIVLVIVICGIAWVVEKVTELFGASRTYTPRHHHIPNSSDDIREYDINEIRASGNFSASERKAEYRRRGKSPSGVIDGVYNDMYRGNDSYNDSYRDTDADA